MPAALLKRRLRRNSIVKVLNFGSLNIDNTYRLDHIVRPGETITSKKLEIFPGGKGLNQSVALAKAGVQVYHAGMIGEDGRFLKDICRKSGVNTEYIRETETRTGNAMIQVSDEGQNSIILFAGANRELTSEFIGEVLDKFEAGDILLLQNEVNRLDELISRGKEKGMTVVLNPSPYDEKIEECDLQKVDLFFVNEVEAGQMTGEKQPEKMLEKMRKMYPRSKIVLTLGEKGSCFGGSGEIYYQEAVQASAVDTTAAGDTFTGFFLASYIRDSSGKNALRYAAAASAMAVERQGASVSIPYKAEVDEKLRHII